MELVGPQMIKDNFNPFLHFLNVSIFVIFVIRNVRITLKIFRQYLLRGDFPLIILCAPVVSDGRKHVWSWTANKGHSLLTLMRGSWQFCSGVYFFWEKGIPQKSSQKRQALWEMGSLHFISFHLMFIFRKLELISQKANFYNRFHFQNPVLKF